MERDYGLISKYRATIEPCEVDAGKCDEENMRILGISRLEKSVWMVSKVSRKIIEYLRRVV